MKQHNTFTLKDFIIRQSLYILLLLLYSAYLSLE